MFGNAHLGRFRQAFTDQISEAGHDFIYRKYQKGAPFRVSRKERDGFIATFNKRIRYASWSIVPATIVLIMLLVWLIPDADMLVAQIAMWVGIAAIVLPFSMIFYCAFGAPSRELERWVPEGSALSKEEAIALAFSNITYGQLVLSALVGIGLIWKMSTKVDMFHGSGLVWLLFGAALVILAGVQAIRKSRYNRR